MEKVLVIDPEKCTGCRICEQVCSVWHEKVVNPYRARIKIIKWEMEGKVLPMVCRQCDDAPCLEVCPMDAISKENETGIIFINYDKCIGCRMCVSICPFGAMSYDFVGNKVMKCDLCDGDPQCVRFCDAQAIRFEDKATANEKTRRKAAKQVMDAVN
ncbi:MAG: 4Fe-4S dicluster domain-containing protein [Deltaproteobacteria bacterium]|nr:4Fe-4S dicluster domain-containing protein [Deltaproteobacteria bacterium]